MRRRVPGLGALSLARFASRVREAVRLPGAVNILVSDDRELRKLNRQFRGKNHPTDVLSFPANDVNKFAGDLAISVQMAARNARPLGHSTADEVKILVLHGVLHLAGYDHERDNGRMARKEQQLRRRLGLPLGLIERASRPQKSLFALRRRSRTSR